MAHGEILIWPTGFGFGPVGKALTLYRSLRVRGASVRLVLDRVSGWLGRKEDDLCVLDLTEATEDDLQEIVRESALVVSIMDERAMDTGRKLGLKTVILDSLFWMWDVVPPAFLSADAYIVQRFPGIERHLCTLKSDMDCVHVVGPIVTEPDGPWGARRTGAILTLGGGTYPFGDAALMDAYVHRLLQVIAESSVHSLFGSVTVAGGENCLKAVSPVLEQCGWIGKTLPHTEFLRQLSLAQVVISSPGLTTFFEGAARRTPVVFLPPQNYSQYWNLLTFRERGLGVSPYHWTDLPHPVVLTRDVPEEAGVNAVQQGLKQFVEDTRAQEDFLHAFEGGLKRVSAETGLSEEAFFREMGGCGTGQACDIILGLTC